MVIDLLGEQDMAPPQSTQVKKVNYIFNFCPNLISQNNFTFMLQKVVIKRKKVDPELANELPMVKRLCPVCYFHHQVLRRSWWQ